MTDATPPFDAMMAAGQNWAKQFGLDLDAFVPEGFADALPTLPNALMEQVMGKGANPQGLDAKTRLLLTLQGLTIAGGTAVPQIKLTVRHAVEAGATPQEIAETIAQAAVFGGAPAMTKAMEIATDVLNKDTSK